MKLLLDSFRRCRYALFVIVPGTVVNDGLVEHVGSVQMRYEPPPLTEIGTLPLMPVIWTTFEL